MLTRELIQQMHEADLRTKVLIPLLQAMGFRDVFEHHGGSGEQGKDIVCWKTDELGARVNYALVVKAKSISGQAKLAKGTAAEVAFQVSQSFGEPFLDPVTSEEREVHLCWVVSNHEITKEAEESIKSAISAAGLNRQTRFINGDKLWELVEQHMPEWAVWQKLAEANKVFDEVDTHYRPRVVLSGSEVSVSLDEKYPGAAEERPITIHSTFAFPKTPEGQAAREAFERYIATGAPVDIPAEFVQSFEPPELVKRLTGLGDSLALSVHMSSIPESREVPVRFDLRCDDGDSFSIEYVQLRVVQAGQEEVTLSNGEQAIPFHVTLVLRREDRRAKVTFRSKTLPLNVSQLYAILRLQRCLSKPCFTQVTYLETDLPLFEMRRGAGIGTAPDPNFVEAIKDLVAVQMKVKRPITVPDREFTDEELRTIGRLRTVLRKGELRGRWEELKVSLVPDGARHALEAGQGGQPLWLRSEAEETEELFGIELPLGVVRISYERIKLVNEDEVRQGLDMNLPEIELRFVPTTSNEVIMQYLEWLPPAQPDSS